MRSSTKSKERKRTASIKTIRLRKKARMMRFLNVVDEVEDSNDEGSVVDQGGKEEPEMIDLCDTDLSDEGKVEDEIDEFDGIEDIDEFDGIEDIDEFDGIEDIDEFDGIEDVEDNLDRSLPELSQAFADLDGEEITDDLFSEPPSPDLTRDQVLPGDSDDDESSSEPELELESPVSSPKEARDKALSVLKERRRVSQAKPKGIKREDTGLRRMYRQPTPDADPLEVYSSEEEALAPKKRIRDNRVPSRKWMKRFFEGREYCIVPQ